MHNVTHTYIQLYSGIYWYIYIYVCICFVNVCIYLFIYTHIHLSLYIGICISCFRLPIACCQSHIAYLAAFSQVRDAYVGHSKCTEQLHHLETNIHEYDQGTTYPACGTHMLPQTSVATTVNIELKWDNPLRSINWLVVHRELIWCTAQTRSIPGSMHTFWYKHFTQNNKTKSLLYQNKPYASKRIAWSSKTISVQLAMLVG